MLKPCTLALAAALVAVPMLGSCGAESADGSEVSNRSRNETQPPAEPVTAAQATWIVYTVPG